MIPENSDQPIGHLRVQRCQDRWAGQRARTVSWINMSRIHQYPGRGSGRSCRDQKNPARVTIAAVSQMISPAARTHGVAPDKIKMAPATATLSPMYPTPERPDRHPPMRAVLQFWRLVHTETVHH